jgi:hypothetical protein
MMAYHNKLVAAVKCNGKVLREFKDTVYIKFGSEYSLLLKNLSTQRALINVFIDGEDQCPSGLVLNAGQEVDLERSIKNNNLTEGNRFKFVQMTNAIEQHRGTKLEDGIITITYQFEKPRPVIEHPWITASGSTYNTGILRGTTAEWISPPIRTIFSSTSETSMNISAQTTMDSYVSDVGITVPGSHSTQSFTTTTMGIMEAEKHNIVLKLLGETDDNKAIREPVTVKRKVKCQTCGKQNKQTAKFCQECGTALEIFA